MATSQSLGSVVRSSSPTQRPVRVRGTSARHRPVSSHYAPWTPHYDTSLTTRSCIIYSGDESMHLPVVSKRRAATPSRKQLDALVEASPPRAVADRDPNQGNSRAPRKLMRKQPSVMESDLFTPPRAPGMYTKPSSSSVNTFDSSTSDMDSLLEKPMPLPPSSQTSVKILGRTGASTTHLPRPETPDKDLPPPPPPKSPPPSERPMSVLSAVTVKQSFTSPAASLVHPAFKRSLPSTSSASLVHPSQRLQSLGSLNMSSTGLTSQHLTTNALTESPQAITSPSVPPPQPTPSKPTPQPPQPGPSTPSHKPLTNGTSDPPPTTAPTAPTPPSALRDAQALVKARRRVSAEFGTYDINSARKERELVLNSPSDESPKPSDSKRSSMVLAGGYQAAVRDEARSPSTTPVRPPPPGAAIPTQLKDRYRMHGQENDQSGSPVSSRREPVSPQQVGDSRRHRTSIDDRLLPSVLRLKHLMRPVLPKRIREQRRGIQSSQRPLQGNVPRAGTRPHSTHLPRFEIRELPNQHPRLRPYRPPTRPPSVMERGAPTLSAQASASPITDLFRGLQHREKSFR